MKLKKIRAETAIYPRLFNHYPGVASTPAFRNDVIVRGGGPNENRFYIDNVEIPYLNHFSTQGASGGPVGIINVDFVQSVDFLSGAFPASKGNALSSILNFTFIDGNKDKMKYRATVGASDLGLTLDGPAGENRHPSAVSKKILSAISFQCSSTSISSDIYRFPAQIQDTT